MKKMSNSETYDLMTNYQDPDEFWQFFDAEQSSPEDYVLEYVEEAKDEMLPEDTRSSEDIAEAMMRYLDQVRSDGSLEKFKNPLEENTTIQLKKRTLARLKKIKAELYRERGDRSYDEIVNLAIDKFEGLK